MASTDVAVDSQPARPAGTRRDRAIGVRLRRFARGAWPPLAVLVVLIVLWEVVVNVFSVSAEIVPGPRLVASATWADRANLWPAMVTTTEEAILGILAATLVAVLLAVAIDWSKTVRRSVYPLMVTSQTLPIIVLAPLVVIWFGFGMAPKIGLVALFTFFPICVGAVQGLASSDADAMALLRTMGAKRGQLLTRIRIPSALPQFFTGLKVAVTYAYVSAIFAEYVGGTQGLGVYMQVSKNNFRTELVFGAIFATTLLTLGLFLVVVALEHLALPWRRPARGEDGW
jgi:ABC-type nitrate/sulfonate/bicarbonate transport system permease component